MRLKAPRVALFVRRQHRADGQRRDDGGGNRICPRPPPGRPRSARCGRHRDSLVAGPIWYLLQLPLDGLGFSSSTSSESHSISILRPSDTPSTLFLFLGDDENRYTSSPPNPMVRPPVFPQQQPPHSRLLPCPLRSTTPGRSEPRTPPPPPPPPPFSFLAHLTCLRLPHLFFMSRLPNCTTLH